MNLDEIVTKQQEVDDEKMGKQRFLQVLPTLTGLLASPEVYYNLEKSGQRVDWKALVEAVVDACGYEPRSPIVVEQYPAKSGIVVEKVKDEV